MVTGAVVGQHCPRVYGWIIFKECNLPRVDRLDLPSLVVQVCKSVETVRAQAGVDVVNVKTAETDPAEKQDWFQTGFKIEQSIKNIVL